MAGHSCFFFTVLGLVGLITSSFLNRDGGTELGLDTGIGELNLELSSDLTSRGMELSLPFRITFPGVPGKMRAQLRAVSVTLASGRTV